MSPSSKVVFQSEGLWCYQAPNSEKDIYSSFPAVSAIAAVNEGKCGSYFVQCRAQHLILKRGAALWSMDKVNYQKKKKKGLNISTLYTRKLQLLKCNSRLHLLEVPSPQGCTLWPGCSSPAVPVKAEGLLSVFLSLLMQMVEFCSEALSAVVLGGVSAVPGARGSARPWLHKPNG